MRIFVDPCVLSRIGLGSQVYKVSEPGKPGFRGLTATDQYFNEYEYYGAFLGVFFSKKIKIMFFQVLNAF